MGHFSWTDDYDPTWTKRDERHEKLKEIADGKPRDVGPPFPQFSPSGSWVEQGPGAEGWRSSCEWETDSTGTRIQRISQRDGGRQAPLEQQGDKAEQDDTRRDERDTERERDSEWCDVI